jgi:hypothetical protein
MHLDRLKPWRGRCESHRGTDHELALVKKSSQDATVQERLQQAGRMSMEMVNLVRLSVDLHTRETVKLHRVFTVLELKRPRAVLKLGNLRWSTKSVMHAGRPCSDERCAQCVFSV